MILSFGVSILLVPACGADELWASNVGRQRMRRAKPPASARLCLLFLEKKRHAPTQVVSSDVRAGWQRERACQPGPAPTIRPGWSAPQTNRRENMGTSDNPTCSGRQLGLKCRLTPANRDDSARVLGTSNEASRKRLRARRYTPRWAATAYESSPEHSCGRHYARSAEHFNRSVVPATVVGLRGMDSALTGYRGPAVTALASCPQQRRVNDGQRWPCREARWTTVALLRSKVDNGQPRASERHPHR